MNASAPFRDDHGWLKPFALHVGIAESLLEQFVSIPKRIHPTMDLPTLDELEHEAHVAWQGVWDHVRQARDLAAARGRDVSASDAARALAGDIFINVTDVQKWREGRRLKVRWRSVSTEPAVRAIAALKAIAPEVVVQREPAPNVDLRSGAAKHGGTIVSILIVLAAALALWRMA